MSEGALAWGQDPGDLETSCQRCINMSPRLRPMVVFPCGVGSGPAPSSQMSWLRPVSQTATSENTLGCSRMFWSRIRVKK